MRVGTASRGRVENRAANGESDTETALRQKMRLHPTGRRISNDLDVTSVIAEVEDETEFRAAHARRAIVSINGEDVDEQSLMKRKTG
jgi:hypothetical protein